jgi:hypothetical protein
MAYQYTDYSGYGNETDEETRRRRAMMLAGLPEGAGFGDMASQAISNRVNQAQNTMTQAGQMISNPEEELRKRMGMGQQTAGPVAPEQVAQPAAQTQVPDQLPAQGPISPEMAQQEFVQPQLPQPGPAVQVAGPAQMPPAQYGGPSQGAEGQTVGQPMVQPAASLAQIAQTQQVATPDQRYQEQIIQAGNETDPAKRRNMFAQILAKEDVSEGNKVLANRLIAEDYMKQKAISDAEQKIAKATPNDLSRYMKERTKEGSYVKAILYARLGLNDLAQKEQELLSPSLKMSSAIDSTGKQYTVERDSKGAIVRGFDQTGKTIGQETLANLSAAAMPTQSFMLPQSGGGLMQKTIMGPDGQPQVITGQVFTDPRTNTTYFQAGNQRYDTSGLTTPAQNVQAIYGGAGAGQQGKQAATTGVQQPALPPMAGQPQMQPAPQMQQPQATGQQGQTMPQAAQAQPQVTATAGPQGGVKLTPNKTAGGGTVVTQRPGESFASYEQRLKASQEQTSANIQAGKEIRVAEAKPPAEERGKMEAKDIKNQNFADSSYSLIKPISDEIKKSTGSGIGAGVDVLAAQLGASTKGAQSIAKLEVLSYPILANVPRFEGPQSDYDVQLYRQAAGDFANASKPVATRLAALDAMITILKKYDKAGKNDWTFGSGKSTEGSGTTSSGNKYKRVQ